MPCVLRAAVDDGRPGRARGGHGRRHLTATPPALRHPSREPHLSGHLPVTREMGVAALRAKRHVKRHVKIHAKRHVKRHATEVALERMECTRRGMRSSSSSRPFASERPGVCVCGMLDARPCLRSARVKVTRPWPLPTRRSGWTQNRR
eukprot:3938494-Rhodomonas_salina.1